MSDLAALNISQAAEAVHLSRDTIRRAMDEWTATGGRSGLRHFRLSARRLCRAEMLREWMSAMERTSARGW